MASPPKGFRPHMPLRAQRDACLLMLGIDPTDCEWDHSPALHLREWDEEAQDTIPAANDPRYITPLSKASHGAKTNGAGSTTAGSDKNRIAKVRRLEKQNAEFVRRMSEKGDEPDEPQRRFRWPKRRMRNGKADHQGRA